MARGDARARFRLRGRFVKRADYLEYLKATRDEVRTRLLRERSTVEGRKIRPKVVEALFRFGEFLQNRLDTVVRLDIEGRDKYADRGRGGIFDVRVKITMPAQPLDALSRAIEDYAELKGIHPRVFRTMFRADIGAGEVRSLSFANKYYAAALEAADSIETLDNRYGTKDVSVLYTSLEQ